MNMLCTLCRQHGISCRKQLPAAYIIEKKEKSTDDLLFDLASKNIPMPTYFVKVLLILQLNMTYQTTRSSGFQARQPGPVVRARGTGSPTDHRPPQNAFKG